MTRMQTFALRKAIFVAVLRYLTLCWGILPLLGLRDALLRRTENLCAFKAGDHLSTDAPPFLRSDASARPTTARVQRRSSLSLGVSRGKRGQLEKLAENLERSERVKQATPNCRAPSDWNETSNAKANPAQCEPGRASC